jgi:hypothetical protein
MRQAKRWCIAVLAAGFLCLAGHAQDDQDRDSTELVPGPLDRATLDGVVFKTLRDVITRGADLYNSGEISGCYRLFEGSLMTLRPLLDHRPELQKAIANGQAAAERDPVVWRRCFTLRAVLDKIRSETHPLKASAKPPIKKPDDGKKDERKKDDPKKDDKKKDESEKDDPKKDDKKKGEKKDDPKKGEKKDDKGEKDD